MYHLVSNKKSNWLVVVILICLGFSSCGHIRVPPSTVTLPGVLQGIFLPCHNPQTSPYPIPYSGMITTYYFDGSSKFQLSQYPFTVAAPDLNSNVNFDLVIPSNGVGWSLEFTVVGACSKCAVVDYPGDFCIQTEGTQNGINGTFAARPVVTYVGSERVGKPPGLAPYVWIFGRGSKDKNYAGSCQCLVPYQ
jgi:hypothetical protein